MNKFEWMCVLLDVLRFLFGSSANISESFGPITLKFWNQITRTKTQKRTFYPQKHSNCVFYSQLQQHCCIVSVILKCQFWAKQCSKMGILRHTSLLLYKNQANIQLNKKKWIYIKRTAEFTWQCIWRIIQEYYTHQHHYSSKIILGELENCIATWVTIFENILTMIIIDIFTIK